MIGLVPCDGSPDPVPVIEGLTQEAALKMMQDPRIRHETWSVAHAVAVSAAVREIIAVSGSKFESVHTTRFFTP